jgi:hypothetical protein
LSNRISVAGGVCCSPGGVAAVAFAAGRDLEVELAAGMAPADDELKGATADGSGAVNSSWSSGMPLGILSAHQNASAVSSQDGVAVVAVSEDCMQDASKPAASSQEGAAFAAMSMHARCQQPGMI